jgi:hypothetical protein
MNSSTHSFLISRIVKPGAIFFLSCLLFVTLPNRLNAQQSKIKIKGIKVKKLNLNFDAQGKILKYLKLEDNNAATREITSEQTFSLTDNYSNLNFRWKNPLKYTFTWKDSTYADEQQAALKDFLKLLTPLFNLPDAGSAANNSASLTNAKATAVVANNAIEPPGGGFKDYDLTQLYIQLILAKDLIKPEERIDINKFTPKLKQLEGGDIDYQAKAKASFSELFNETNPFKVTNDNNPKDGTADIAADNVKSWLESLKKNSSLHDQLVSELADIKIENELFNSLFYTGISKYLDKSKTLNSANVAIVNKLTPLIAKLKNSVIDDFIPFAYGNVTDLVHVRAIKLEEGKVLQTELVITKYKIAEDGLSVVKDAESDKVKLIFRGYDPIIFSVSTGLFYGSTSIKGFGTANSGTDMIVTQDTIKNNTAVTAIFGNLTFGIGSRLLAPTIQLGVDPTKKHPFFLLGGGLAFPVANFAITSGGIWTFEPTLSKLKPGDKISSTTELEKDVKNNFQLKPKGWYLGIQYNF